MINDRISAQTSTRNKTVWETHPDNLKEVMFALAGQLKYLCDYHLKEELLFIVAKNHGLLDFILEAIRPNYETIELGIDQLSNFSRPETKKRRCFMTWYDCDTFPKWIEKGIITKEDVIFFLGKDKNKSLFYSTCEVVNIWNNAEGSRIGLQFKDCDKDRWHIFGNKVMNVEDDQVAFEQKEICKCGCAGITFIPKE